MANKSGYMRNRRSDGTFDTFLPITTAENVDMGENQNLAEVIADVHEEIGTSRTQIDTHAKDASAHLTPEYKTSLDGRFKTLTDSVSGITTRLGTQQDTSKTISSLGARKTISMDITKGGILRGLSASGRVLPNLMGARGANTLRGWMTTSGTLSYTNEQALEGQSVFKFIADSTASAEYYAGIDNELIDVGSGETYEIRVNMMKLSNAAAGSYRLRVISLNSSGTNIKDEVVELTVSNKFQTLRLRRDTTAAGKLMIRIMTPAGGTVYFSRVRVVRMVTGLDNDYAANPAGFELPYSEGLVPVENPYVVYRGQNMVPGYSFWRRGTTGTLVKSSETHASLSAQGADSLYFVDVRVPPSTEMTYNIQHNGKIGVALLDKDIIETPISGWVSDQSISFTTAADTTHVRLFIGNNGLSSNGSFYFQNPSLTPTVNGYISSKISPQFMIYPVKLYGPIHATGTQPDLLNPDYRGTTIRQARWVRFALNEEWTFTYTGSGTGYKYVTVTGAQFDKFYGRLRTQTGSSFVFKNTKQLLKDPGYGVTNIPANTGRINDNGIVIGIANVDSGWADNYTPTTEEIRAYFMGWKMFTSGQAATTNLYNGTGVKYWGYWDYNGNIVSGTATTPTLVAYDNANCPYSFYEVLGSTVEVYVEEVIPEGMIVFPSAGTVVLEMGTGAVIRESIRPNVPDGDTMAYINDITQAPTSRLSGIVDQVLSVHRNGTIEQWPVDQSDRIPNGRYMLSLPLASFMDKANYQVTYLKSTNHIPASTYLRFEVGTSERSEIEAIRQDMSRVESQLRVSKRQRTDYVRNPGYIGKTTTVDRQTYIGRLDPDPQEAVLPEGFAVTVVFNVSNTGPVYLRINEAKAVPIVSREGTLLAAGDLKSGVPYALRVVGGNFTLSSGEGVKLNGSSIVTAEYSESINGGDVVGIRDDYKNIKSHQDVNILFSGVGTVVDVAYSPNGEHLAVATTSRPYLSLFKVSKNDGTDFVKLPNPAVLPTTPFKTNTTTATRLTNWDSQFPYSRSMMYSADGKYLLMSSGTVDTYLGQLYRIDGDTYTKCATFNRPIAYENYFIRAFCISPDGASIILGAVTDDSTTTNKIIHIRRTTDMGGYQWSEIATSATTNSTYISDMDFSPDGLRFAVSFISSTAGGNLRQVWRRADTTSSTFTGDTLTVNTGNRGSSYKVRFSKDGSQLVFRNGRYYDLYSFFYHPSYNALLPQLDGSVTIPQIGSSYHLDDHTGFIDSDGDFITAAALTAAVSENAIQRVKLKDKKIADYVPVFPIKMNSTSARVQAMDVHPITKKIIMFITENPSVNNVGYLYSVEKYTNVAKVANVDAVSSRQFLGGIGVAQATGSTGQSSKVSRFLT